MRTILVMIAAVLVAGCLPTTMPTPAIIARLYATPKSPERQFVLCTVELGWTQDELDNHCGPPERLVAWAGHPGDRCALYRTSARGFGSGQGVEALAVCMRKETTAIRSSWSAPAGTEVVERVAAVAGLEASVLSDMPSTAAPLPR
jgi:hypothetical protein